MQNNATNGMKTKKKNNAYMHLENIVPPVAIRLYTAGCCWKVINPTLREGTTPVAFGIYGPADGRTEEKKSCGRFEKINAKTKTHYYNGCILYNITAG